MPPFFFAIVWWSVLIAMTTLPTIAGSSNTCEA